MLVLALTLPILAALDTLVFEDGTTHFLDETTVNADDDIVVRGIGFGAGQRTTVFLTSMAEAREVMLRPGGTVTIQDSARVARVVTEAVSFSNARLDVTDSGVIEGALTLSRNAVATLSGSASVGSVVVEDDNWLNLEEDATVQGDVTSLGTVRVAGGRVLGTLDLQAGFIVDESAGPLEFAGPVKISAYGQPSFTRSRFQSDLEVAGQVRMELSGTSEVLGILKVREQATATLFLGSASVPSGYITEPSGVIIGTDANGDHVFYAYERDPGATLIIERADEPTSTTACVQSLPNSSGVAAHVLAFGGTDASAGQLVLRAVDLPTNSFSFFFVGTSLEPGTAPSGDICTGGNIGRFLGPHIQSSGASGSITATIDTTQMPGNPLTIAVPGSTYYFQTWNRDLINGAPTSRFSDTAAVTFR